MDRVTVWVGDLVWSNGCEIRYVFLLFVCLLMQVKVSNANLKPISFTVAFTTKKNANPKCNPNPTS